MLARFAVNSECRAAALAPPSVSVALLLQQKAQLISLYVTCHLVVDNARRRANRRLFGSSLRCASTHTSNSSSEALVSKQNITKNVYIRLAAVDSRRSRIINVYIGHHTAARLTILAEVICARTTHVQEEELQAPLLKSLVRNAHLPHAHSTA